MSEEAYWGRLDTLLRELAEVSLRMPSQRRREPRLPTVTFDTNAPRLGSEFKSALPRPTYWRW
jgi:hypothetical protein